MTQPASQHDASHLDSAITALHTATTREQAAQIAAGITGNRNLAGVAAALGCDASPHASAGGLRREIIRAVGDRLDSEAILACGHTSRPVTPDTTPGQDAHAAWRDARDLIGDLPWEHLTAGERAAWEAAGRAAQTGPRRVVDIPAADWDIRDYPPPEVTVAAIVMAVEGGSDDDDRVIVTHASGRPLVFAGSMALPDGRVQIVIDEAPPSIAARPPSATSLP